MYYNNRNKKIAQIKSSSEDIRFIQKRINESLAKIQSLKEEQFQYPNMENDIKEDIEKFKANLSNYLINVDQNSYKFLNDNVIVNGNATIKNITFGFSYSLDEEGCLVVYPKDAKALPLYNEIISFFDDLKKYFLIWRDSWIQKLNDLKS